MNATAAKLTIEQRFQALKDEQRHQYHLTHDCFTGRPLTAQQLQRWYDDTVDVAVQKKQRNLDSLNEVLYPAPTLGSVLGDSLAALKPKIEPADVVALEKPSEGLLNRVKNWFAKYQSEGLESLLPEQSRLLNEANLAVIKRALSHSTLLIQNVCILSAFWIRNPLDWDAQGETDLLEHLFVHYEAPAFLRACWLNPADEENLRWLLCFVMYSQGGSLKALATYFAWTTASQKLWHQLFMCPANMTAQRAVLYTEFKRLGGWDEDFACLMRNESYVIDLLEPASEAGRDFWYDTCRWTISRQFELTVEQLGKVLWWARHQFTEYARNDQSYSLQGRSTARVLESIAEYDNRQRQIELARARMAERARQVSMAREEERTRLREVYEREQAARELLLAEQNGEYIDYAAIDVSWKPRGWSWTTMAHGKKWHFVELTTSQELRDEGDAMDHCVGAYSLSCLEGEAAIFSLQSQGFRKVTIEVDPLTKRLIQVQGKYNAEPAQAVQAVVDAWMMRVVK